MSCIERAGHGIGRVVVVLLLLLLVCLPGRGLAQSYGDFTYTVSGDAVTLTGYTGPGGAVTIPSSIPEVGTVTTIGPWAFVYSSLTSVTLPAGLTTIGDDAFYGCSGLTSVTIPAGVTSIGIEVFVRCSGLTNITVDAQNTQYSSVDGVLFDKNAATLLQYPGGKQGSYTIPANVTDIGAKAFYFCSSLTSVTIPHTVAVIGNGAFMNCTSLASAWFRGDAPLSFGSQVFYAVQSGFVIHYSTTTSGWASPTWNGYWTEFYTPGYLLVTLDPAAAISAGAQWQLDGGPWQDSGAILSDLVPGNHTVGFKSVNGWATPENQNVTISPYQLTRATASYVAQPSTPLLMSIAPAAPGTPAAFRLDSMGLMPNLTYQVQASTNLNDWTNFGASFVATATTHSLYLDRQTGNCFFRLLYLP